MLTLFGFGASNYHNKVKLALIEKGVAFEEELVWVGDTDPDASPLGKCPTSKQTTAPCVNQLSFWNTSSKLIQNIH